MSGPENPGLTSAAEELAHTTAALVVRGPLRRSRRRLLRLRERVQAVYAGLETGERRGASAEEWLLDNRHLVMGACTQVRTDLTPGFLASLPKADDQGTTRAELLARGLMSVSGGFVDRDAIERYVTAFQRVAALRVGELWALPAFLRVCALESLVRAAGRTAASVPEGEAIEEVSGEEVSTAILCLRSLDAEDWKEVVEALSVVDRCLRTLDPAGTYKDMDFHTRDRYRQAVEELARWTGRSELAVAQEAVRASRARSGDGAHVGEVLIGSGRRRFEAELEVGHPPRRWLRRVLFRCAGPGYFAILLVLTGALALLMISPLAKGAASTWLLVAVGFVTVIPSSAAGVAVANAVATRLVPPRVLPKMDFGRGLPADCRTCVAVPAILGRVEEVEELLRGLEVNYLANRDPNLRFVLLADPCDAEAESTPRDEAVLAAAVEGMRALNLRHGGPEGEPFYLLSRSRLWNPKQRRWMAWERKRGKLQEFNRLLITGELGGLVPRVGEPKDLRGTRFVLTLDADTRLPSGVAARLAGALAHPLNRARWDADGRVIRGYTVLQPRIDTHPGHPASLFTRIFQGEEGLDLYSNAASDVYQDLFKEGIFAGKGIYDVAAFGRAVEGRIPTDAILSHDLFEGVLGRAGLVSDVAVLEDFPATPGSYMRRLHRWIRGDWQLVPWLRRSVPSTEGPRIANPLSWLAQWKILDNLRRSLLAPGLLVLLILGWSGLPGGTSWWTAWCAGLLAVPILVPLVVGTRSYLTASMPMAPFWRTRRVRWAFGRWLVGLALLPWEAWVVLDAVTRTLFRLAVTRRYLLEWTPAAATSRAMAGGLGPRFYFAEMRWALFLPAAFAVTAASVGVLATGMALPWLLAWSVSPFAAWLLGRPPDAPAIAGFSRGERRELRLLLRRGWAFFERYAGPDDHWLPPDHVQFDPPVGTAHRTSPTNVGLALVTAQIAVDMGHLPLGRFVARIAATLDTLSRLETYRGHFLNWYDTRRLVALHPRYVSTVDSGNLAACMWSVSAGLRSLLEAPPPLTSAIGGLADSLDLAAEHLRALGLSDASTLRLARGLRRWPKQPVALGSPSPSPPFDAWHAQLLGLEQEILASVAGTRPPAAEMAELRWWLAATGRSLAALQEEWETLLPWGPLLGTPPEELSAAPVDSPLGREWGELRAALSHRPTLDALPAYHRRVQELVTRLIRAAGAPTHYPDGGFDSLRVEAWAEGFRAPLARAEAAAEGLRKSTVDCADRLDRFVRDMDFRFLFDPSRKLFHIGYNADAVALDHSYYDLFASEARLASYIAIMLDQIPPEHWLNLRRPFRRLEEGAALVSWGGSMFEYLLPSLFLRTPEGSLSHQACHGAVRAQIQFGRKLGLPWGVSESAYGETDEGRRYRYRAFGVPSLALHRDAAPRVVVAPYAMGLAMTIAPREALEELRRARGMGLEGPVGYWDAADFGESGGRGNAPRVVQTIMAHHQGMLLAGVHHALTGGAMVDRFHRAAEAQALEFLLHERAPGSVRVTCEATAPRVRPVTPPLPAAVPPWHVAPATFPPESTALANGRLSAFVMANGGGGLRWEGFDIFRWRPDPTWVAWGEWGYVLDRSTGEMHSVARAPTWARAEHEEVLFGESSVEFHRDVGPLRLRTRITVAPSADVEIREVGVVNETSRPRTVEVTTLAEVALARPSEDRRHPAFARLFVEADPDLRTGTLWFNRRAEGLDDTPLCLGVRYVPVSGDWTMVGWEVDRERFLGRLGGLSTPRGVQTPHAGRPPGGAWAPIDPVASWSLRVTIPPGGEAVVAFLNGVGHARGSVTRALETLHSPGSFVVARNHLRDRCRRLRQRLGVEPHEPPLFQRLLTRLAFPYRVHPGDPGPMSGDGSGQEFLWSLGVSGDRPVMTVVRRPEAQGPLLRQLLRAHPYLAARGVEFDLVVVGREQDAYGEPVRGWIEATLRDMGLLRRLNAAGGVFYLPGGRISGPSEARLREASTLFAGEDVESLEGFLVESPEEGIELPDFVPVPSSPLQPTDDPPLPALADLHFGGPWGGHAPAARSFVIELDEGSRTPAPWSNVLANPVFGTLVTESGGGYSWAENAGESRLTPFANDPVRDPAGEILYLRDEETGEVWTPTPAPSGVPPHRVVHRAEATVFRNRAHGLDQALHIWLPEGGSAKVFDLRVSDCRKRPRRVTATLYVEWVLGNRRAVTAPHITTSFDPGNGILQARCPFPPGPYPRVGVVAADAPVHGFTCDRREFLGDAGDRARPAGLRRVGLAGKVGAGLDPCAVLQLHLDIPAGGQRRVRFFLVSARTLDAAEEAVAALRGEGGGARARVAVRRQWRGLLDSLTVRTPEPAMDRLLNGWLLHQTLASRIWGRTGYYQSSGAFGFRDQLQDSLAFLHQAPALCRERILDAARHQFPEGDVLHWWHPPDDRGVRTRCSDDRLWLPYVTAGYLSATGDRGLLDEPVPYLVGPLLEPGQSERYDVYPASGEATLYDHCLRALERDGILSPRGLPLLGTGDWNDGLNRAGRSGQGESVWLAWFLIDVLTRFAPLCRERGEPSRGEALEVRAKALKEAVERLAWDGSWYIRGTYDDGFPLGSSANEEGRIDSLPQTWAVLSGAGDPQRCRTAMESVWRELVDREARIVRLLKPPFQMTRRSPGYIKSYPPGVRENGGQYTHAATWVGWAFTLLGDGDRAEEVFRILNPLLRPDSGDPYRVEPYVVAGDVYGEPPHRGRGGWTWYTGSAAWLYRLGMEQILGIQPVPDGIRIQPCIPRRWTGYQAERRVGTARYLIRVENPGRGTGALETLTLDGVPLHAPVVPLHDDGRRHEVVARLQPAREGVGRPVPSPS